MGKILIVKDADFSQNGVKVFSVVFDYTNIEGGEVSSALLSNNAVSGLCIPISKGKIFNSLELTFVKDSSLNKTIYFEKYNRVTMESTTIKSITVQKLDTPTVVNFDENVVLGDNEFLCITDNVTSASPDQWTFILTKTIQGDTTKALAYRHTDDSYDDHNWPGIYPMIKALLI